MIVEKKTGKKHIYLTHTDVITSTHIGNNISLKRELISYLLSFTYSIDKTRIDN
jgi:hypothetical protein